LHDHIHALQEKMQAVRQVNVGAAIGAGAKLG
jgi:hypothetical protein